MTFFIIKMAVSADYPAAIFMLSYYKVKMVAFSNGEDAESSYLMVMPDYEANKDAENPEKEADAQYCLAEMCFAANAQSASKNICSHCQSEIEKTGEGEAFCGHQEFKRLF